jgi:cell division septal protein FtsQ
MARRKKGNNNMKGISKGFIIFVFCAAFLYIFYNAVGKFFHQSPFFSIQEIVTAPSFDFIKSRSLDQLYGQNIFQADVKAVEKRLRLEYPAVDHLRVARRFPNRILVVAERRDPFAVISFDHQDAAVDESGALIGTDVTAKGKLPYLTGITDATMGHPGKPLASRRLAVGLAIIKAVRANDAVKQYAVHSIDLTSLSQIHLRLETVEVVLEQFDIEKKISVLGLLLSDPAVAADQVNYVDLRFKDPVVKKR